MTLPGHRITTIMYDFLPVLIFRYFFHLAFLIIGSYIVFNSILGLLSRSLKPNVCADSLRRLILQCSALSIISTLSHEGKWFPFSFHIWLPYPTFQSHLVLLPSDVLLAKWATCLTFVYFTTTAKDGVSTVLGHVEFRCWLDPEEIPPDSWTTCEYCRDVIWTTYLLDPFG